MADDAPSRDPLVVEIRYLREAIQELKAARADDKKELLDQLAATNQKVSEMQTLVNKYRGGLAVILGAGALLGWVLSNLTAGMKLWH